jgi:RNA polymerase sigma factor (TIGR02999 family)
MANEAPGQTLQATSLVHEAWLRLVGADGGGWSSRAHFFGAAARAMRRILVEQARRKARLRHGDGRPREDLATAEPEIEPPNDDVLAVDEALRRLEAQDARKGAIVDLRYFSGFSNEETARALGLSVGTIEREWRFIRAWLRTELGERGG